MKISFIQFFFLELNVLPCKHCTEPGTQCPQCRALSLFSLATVTSCDPLVALGTHLHDEKHAFPKADLHFLGPRERAKLQEQGCSCKGWSFEAFGGDSRKTTANSESLEDIQTSNKDPRRRKRE